jgi:dipeptide/tripeptide permease
MAVNVSMLSSSRGSESKQRGRRLCRADGSAGEADRATPPGSRRAARRLPPPPNIRTMEAHAREFRNLKYRGSRAICYAYARSPAARGMARRRSAVERYAALRRIRAERKCMAEKKNVLKSFPATYWVVIMFEFFERGAYYGMMSFLSVYLTENLHFAKESVGVIKGTIQPLLYFLPILSGAIADRFGYRRTLMIAFALLGGGYLLTSQMTTYTAVFLALVVMGIGAGTFKPIISGSIARTTDESNSTLGFGIYYWSINLGAFLFPLILVPWLKNSPLFGPKWVIIASAICTGAMIIPTIFLYREPHRPDKDEAQAKPNLLQTLANAFEIVYSPIVLLYHAVRRSAATATVMYVLTAALAAGSAWLFVARGKFFYLYIAFMFVASFAILMVRGRRAGSSAIRPEIRLLFVAIGAMLWVLPGLTVFARIITSVIYLTVFSLFQIEYGDIPKFKDHAKFLLMIFIYSGFWVLYFQMFDSVLWYVNDYVDASSLDRFVNGILGGRIAFKFDVEHVTVINAGTIILLQLVVSNIVRNIKALPTMIAGIAMGTAGMAILSISANIWVFMAGIVIFSIGEMTAHPKFISYVGLTAPKDRVATYMGYIFLYGVIGSSIGAVLGANLYVHFVDNLHQPRVLWLIFSGIGVATIAGLLLYNRFVKR